MYRSRVTARRKSLFFMEKTTTVIKSTKRGKCLHMATAWKRAANGLHQGSHAVATTLNLQSCRPVSQWQEIMCRYSGKKRQWAWAKKEKKYKKATTTIETTIVTLIFHSFSPAVFHQIGATFFWEVSYATVIILHVISRNHKHNILSINFAKKAGFLAF